jgi:hypothetical protein
MYIRRVGLEELEILLHHDPSNRSSTESAIIAVLSDDVTEHHVHERHYHARFQIPQEMPRKMQTQHGMQHKDSARDARYRYAR